LEGCGIGQLQEIILLFAHRGSQENHEETSMKIAEVPSKYHYRVLLGEISVSHSGKYEDD
jgi:hypothetical protein